MSGGKWVHPAWKVLEIEPTGDLRAIRTAYSARLKSIDPEADPKAFIALREAFEAVRDGAAQMDGERGPLPEIEWQADGGERDWMPEPPARAESRAEPSEADRHAQALGALLYSNGAGAFGLDAAEEAKALEHWHAIIADPRMQDIGYFADIEQWAGQLIAYAPRSAILVIPATEFFGWTADDGSIVQTPAVAEVSRRYRSQRFILAAQHPGHSHYPALAELTAPAYLGSSRGRVDPLTVFLMLAMVRDAWPEIEARFDARRVEIWKHNTADPNSPESRAARGETRPSLAKWIVIGWWGLIALGAIARLAGSH